MILLMHDGSIWAVWQNTACYEISNLINGGTIYMELVSYSEARLFIQDNLCWGR